MIKVVEGSYAVAHAVKTCRPKVISAYPITPQTHIVENLAQFIADGEMECEYINVESEHSALSACIGASATGVRTYTATTSQGLALMFEVLFNASGMRLPIVMTVANRSLSAPLNIWNDQQDSVSCRDCGWIQLYAEDIQEAHDMMIQAYKIAESKDVLLPLMVCMDGFVLTHTYSPVDLAAQEDVDSFLPPYDPEFKLDPDNPMTFGAFAEPDKYEEFRYMQQVAMRNAARRICEVADEFSRKFGRYKGKLIDVYGDDSKVIVTMGSMIGNIKDLIDEDGGAKLVKVRSFRPFPKEEIRKECEDAEVVIVLEKDVSIGHEGALFTEVKSALYSLQERPPCIGFVAGLGGRDVSKDTIRKALEKAGRYAEKVDVSEFLDLRGELL